MAETDPREHTPTPEPHPPREALPTVVPPHNDEKRLRKRTVFYISATVIALVILVMAFYEPISAALQYILSILSPLIIGAVIAYLCDPILEFYEYRLFRRMPKGNLRR
jgi:undecaprenyl pyrophosphate phosphatase UppP